MRVFGFLIAGCISIPILLLLTALTCYSLDTAWKTEQYGDFVFEYPSGTHKTIAFLKRTCSLLEERISEDLPLKEVGEVRVVLVTNMEQFLEKQPEGHLSSPWIAGVAYPEHGLVILKSPRMLLGAQPAFEKVLYHEIAHIALHRALSCRHTTTVHNEDVSSPIPARDPCVPLWLHEGYAIFVAREWSLEREITLGKAVLQRHLIPLGRLVSRFPGEEPGVNLAYAESADLIHFLRNEYGAPAFRTFILHMGKGQRFGGALREAFGVTFQELEHKWVSHLERRYHRFSLLGSVSLVWAMATLLFLAAYIRKKIIVRKIRKRWEDNEDEGHPGANLN